MVSSGKQTNSVCASGEGEELGRVRKRRERRRGREGGREMRGERGRWRGKERLQQDTGLLRERRGEGGERERWRGKERLQQDGGLLQVQRILLFDFSLKPIHLVHGHTLMVACRGECVHSREREIPVITRDIHNM